MSRTLYALLVGINEYPTAEVPNLSGCTDDVDNLDYFLGGEFEDFDPQIVTLLNAEATRENIIQTFRSHLGQAGSNDVVLFHYSGHGSREPAAPEFINIEPDGWDETLVCYDSRPDGLDLADKELAVLIAEVAENEPHIVISLDSCHSGSGTRSASELKLRQISTRATPRSLNDYMDGYYAKNGLNVPESQHLLMSSCTRYELAADGDEGGLYSRGLLDVLENEGKDISYADLYLKCRSSVSRIASEKEHKQHPQFESYNYFNAYGKFLDGRPVANRNRFPVQYDYKNECWCLGYGAINGLPSEPDQKAAVAIYTDRESTEILQNSDISWVGATKSGLMFDYDDQQATLFAEIISLPVPPFPVFVETDDENFSLLTGILAENNGHIGLEFTQDPGECTYRIRIEDDKYLVHDLHRDRLVVGAGPLSKNNAQYIVSQLETVVKWERSLALNNNRPQLNPDDVEFSLLTDSEEVYENVADLTYSGRNIRAKIRVRNEAPQKVYITMLYFHPEYGIFPMNSRPLEPGTGFITLWGDDPDDFFYLEEGQSDTAERFKLLVTTEQADAFLLSQDPLKHFGKVLTNPSFRGLGNFKKKVKVENDWFMKNLTVKVWAPPQALP